MNRAAAVRALREVSRAGEVPLFRHPEWAERYPWLVQGTTGGVDLGLFGDQPVGRALAHWRTLREECGCERAVHALQVHGAHTLWHDGSCVSGLSLTEGWDGHATRAAGLLLTISVADCVPIFLVDPEHRAVAALHGGWRGVAAGVLEAGIVELRERAGTDPAALRVHTGPSICGDCYEVGPEVHEALGLERPSGNTPVDLRAELARRARALGVSADRITTSAFCTRCGDSAFFSHRGGQPERQLGVIALRGREE